MDINEEIIRAKTFHRSNNFAEAKKIYEKLLGSDQNNSDLLYHIGLLSLQTGALPESVGYLQRAAKIDTNNSIILLHLGVACHKLNRMDEAIHYFSLAAKHNAKLHDAKIWLAKALGDTGRIDEAYSILLALSKESSTLAEKFPGWITQLFMRTCFFCAVAENNHKTIFLDKALQLVGVLSQSNSPGHRVFGHHHSGLLYKLMGDLENALKHFREAKNADPGFKSPQFYYELIKEHLSKAASEKQDLDRPRLLFHIGYPKAGSTWIQRSIFPNLCRVNHLGITFYDIIDVNDTYMGHYSYPSFIKKGLFTLNSQSYDPDTFIPYLRDHIRRDVDVNTISHEGLLQVEPRILVERLQQIRDSLDAEVKVLMVIRKQDNIVVSEYGQGIKVNKWRGRTLESLLDWESFTDQSQCMSLGNYDYHSVTDQFVSGLGQKNVLVQPFEEMFTYGALSRILNFMGVEISDSHKKLLIDSPAANAMLSKVKEQISMLNPDLDPLKQRIGQHFLQSNRKLDDTYNLGLKKLGYY